MNDLRVIVLNSQNFNSDKFNLYFNNMENILQVVKIVDHYPQLKQATVQR